MDIGQAIDVGKDVVHSTFNQTVVDEAAQRGVLRLPDDLVRDMTQVLISCCARPYGRRPARNRAEKALRCMARDTGPAPPQVAP
jgi:predicted site-specific integrase-resolvase